MSGNSGSDKSAEALVKAFPQLGSGNENRVSKGAGGEPNLHAVPAPQQPGPGTSLAVPGARLGLEKFWNVPVLVNFEVGRQDITVKQLMSLSRGSILPLKNVYVDSIKVKVGEKTLARAEAISLKSNYGVRVSEVLIPSGLGSEES